MEHTPIAPPGFAPAILGVIPLPEASLALFTLREPHREFFTLSRSELGDTVEALIAILDATEDDPDLELNGDELDGTGAEDDFCGHNVPGHLQGPGCPVADPDTAADDICCDDVDQDLEPEEFSDEFSDPAIRAQHRRRIQRTRCVPRYRIRRHSLTGAIMSREVARYELDEWRAPSLTRRALLKRKRGVPRRPRP